MRRSRALCLSLIAAFAGSYGLPVQAAVTERVCLLQVDVELAACAAAADAVAACAAALSRQPADFNSRASLCEAYVAVGNHAAAIDILETGRSVHRGDQFTQGLIDRVLSNVVEAQSAGQRQAADVGTLVEYMVLRCTMVKNLQNCDEALAIDPANVQALNGRGDILASQGDLGGAISTYRRSLAADSDQPDITARLDASLAKRRERVDACLAATARSAIDTCRALLIPGEADTPDLFGKIGSLELAAGNLGRAHAAYENAAAAGASGEIRDMAGLLSLARDCIDSTDEGVCSRAIDSLPQSQLFRDVRADVMLAGCRAAVASGGDSGLDAAAVCSEARSLDSSVAGEVDRLLASLAPPAIAAPPVPNDRPTDSLTRQCLERYATIGAADAVIDLCERAATNETNATGAADVVAALDTMRSRLAADRAIEQCEAAAPGQAAAACAQALALAGGDAERLAIQRRIEQIEQQQSNERALADLKNRCMNFASAALGDALSDCTVAARRMPNDGEVQKALQTVETLVAAYRNQPIIWVRGNEAVTY